MGGSASTSNGWVPPHDMTSQSQLRNLYNQRVTSAEWVTRPLGSFSAPVGPISHSGVRVTLEDGSNYLIHKGKGYGIKSETVVVDAKHMSQNWKVTQSKTVEGKTVGNFVKEGGANYDLLTDNCHTAAGNMMK